MGAAALAYAGGCAAPWVLDDWQSVVLNPSIRRLGAVATVLTPDHGTTAGRPLLNVSFALNYAFGGAGVWGYHAVNVLIHAAAAALLFGLVRRTLLAPRWQGRFDAAALPLAASVAGLWALHPLATEAVTYVSERAESLMGLCYLATLYAWCRGWRWRAVAACACGMAAKEVMVTAPVLVLLYDRAFLSDSFRAAFARRRGGYLGLAATWLLLALFMTAFPIRDRAVGWSAGITVMRYAATEAVTVLRYLGLAVWPHPLVFDYGPAAFVGWGTAWPAAVVLVGALTGICVLWRRSPERAFPFVAVFVLLAPTSSVVPIALQPVAESRMYLPLAAVIAFGVVGAYRLGARGRLGVGLGLSTAAALGVATVARNATYRSAVGLWRDTVAKAPNNPRAHDSLGTTLQAAGDHAGAMAEFATALRVDGAYAPAAFNLGVGELDAGQAEAAVPFLRAALRVPNREAEAHLYLGEALLQTGKFSEAVGPLREAAKRMPDNIEAHFDLANALFGADHPGAAVVEYQRALELKPGDGTIGAYLARAQRAAR